MPSDFASTKKGDAFFVPGTLACPGYAKKIIRTVRIGDEELDAVENVIRPVRHRRQHDVHRTIAARGLVLGKVITISPSARDGKKDCFCASAPALRIVEPQTTEASKWGPGTSARPISS
jgi:hypothetical protein